MGNFIAVTRVAATLVLALLCACAQADPSPTDFSIVAQPAAPALNEFARQADATLIFSYDSVSVTHTQALHGRFTVDEGLALLLEGTRLSYRKLSDGTYLVCPPAACHASTNPATMQMQTGQKQRE